MNGSDPSYESSRLGDPNGGKYVLDVKGVFVVQKYPVLTLVVLDDAGVVPRI